MTEEAEGWQTVPSSSFPPNKTKKAPTTVITSAPRPATTTTAKTTTTTSSSGSGSSHHHGNNNTKSESHVKKSSSSVVKKDVSATGGKTSTTATSSSRASATASSSSGSITVVGSSSSTGGRKLSQSNKKQGIALFDVLLNKSKPDNKKVVPSDSTAIHANTSKSAMTTTSTEVKKKEEENTTHVKDAKLVEPTPPLPPPAPKLTVYKAPTVAAPSVLPSTSVKATTTMSIEPKKSMLTKDKKKLPSTLKKRILTERLRQHLIQEEKMKELQVIEDIKSSSSTAYQDRTVVIANFIGDDEDVSSMEDDERQELLDNIKDLLSPCGSIFTIDISSLEKKEDNNTPLAESSDGKCHFVVLVTFLHASSALRAVDILQGLVIGGQKIHLQLYSTLLQYSTNQTATSTNDTPSSDGTVVDLKEEKKKGKGEKKKSQSADSSSASILVLSNIITSAEEVEDKEEVMEVLNDIYHLASSSITFQQDIANIWIEESILSVRKHDFLQNLLSPLSSFLPLTIVQVDSYVHAGGLIEALHSKVIGGEILEVGYLWSAHTSSRTFQWLNKEDHNTYMKKLGILFQNMIDEEVAEDEDEVEEILSNIETLLQSQPVFASLSSSFTSNSHRCMHGARDVIWYVDIVEDMENVSELLQDISVMIEGLAKVNLGGSYLQVSLLMSTSSSDDNEWWTPLQYEDSYLLGLRHYLTADDMDDLRMLSSDSSGSSNESHEQIMTFKSDLLTLVERSETSEVVASIRSIDFLHPSFFSSSASSAEELGKRYDVAILFSNGKIAQEAMFYLDQLVLGGNAIDAWIRKYEHNSDSDDQNQGNLRIIQERRVDTSTTTSSLNPLLPSYSPFLQVDITKYQSVYKVNHNDQNTGIGSSSSETNITLPQEKKYQIAKSAPKLLRHGPNALLFESSIPIANEEINLVIKEFLRLISTFQLRLKEKLPANKVKQKLRYVTGMKQTLNSIKACKAKLLIIAPNTEQSDELDAMLSNVIQEAAQREVPTIYGLNKRQLGKSLQMSMKQSVVVIFDPDGAYEYYKKIVRFVTANTKPLPKDVTKS